MFVLPKNLLSCTNVRLQTSAHKKSNDRYIACYGFLYLFSSRYQLVNGTMLVSAVRWQDKQALLQVLCCACGKTCKCAWLCAVAIPRCSNASMLFSTILLSLKPFKYYVTNLKIIFDVCINLIKNKSKLFRVYF